jgi:hypothetical protein
MHDVLMEAKADAPPAKLSVDDLVTAGKRRQRRRSAGWVTVAAAVAAAAIVVPQVVARPNAVPTAAPATAPVNQPAVSYAFSAFTAGPLKVSSPSLWLSTLQMAEVTDVRKKGSFGFLKVYLNGANPLRDFPGFKMVDTDPVNGRHAFFIEKKFSKGTEREFAWDIGGGVAVLQFEATLAEQRRLAEAFRAVPRPLRMSFKVGYVPDGYRFAGAMDNTGGISSTIRVEATGKQAISLSIGEHVQTRTDYTSTPTCYLEIETHRNCVVASDGGRHVIQVTGDVSTDQSELLKILASVRYDRSSSYLVSEALPASALPER